MKSTGPYGHLDYGNQTNGGFGVSVEPLTPPFDTDGDGTFDDEDNCPALANAGQEDLDADGVGNACDNCATTANADQADADADGFTDYPADSACGIGFEMAPLLLGIAALRRAGVASSGMRGA